MSSAALGDVELAIKDGGKEEKGDITEGRGNELFFCFSRLTIHSMNCTRHYEEQQ